MFTCKECGTKVTVVDGVHTRTCGHDSAGILASIKAHARGVSSTKTKSARERIISALWRLVDALRFRGSRV